MIVYKPSFEHDTVLEAWYHELRETRDLQRLFFSDVHCLSGFYTAFHAPTVLMFDLDAQNRVIFAHWFHPAMSVVMEGIWIAVDHRNQRGWIRRLQQTYDVVFEAHRMICSVTQHANLIDEVKRLGYDVYGPINGLWEGAPAWMIVLTKERYQQGWLCRPPRVLTSASK